MSALYLSRLELRTSSRDVQRDLVNCDAMHRRVLLGFPDEPRAEPARERYGVLYRIERLRDGIGVLVQSSVLPDWSRLPGTYLERPAEVKRLDQAYEALRTGMELRFRLGANPTRRIGKNNTAQSEQWRGKRVEVRGEAAELEWLRRKGEQNGFTLVAVHSQATVRDVRTVEGVGVHGQRQTTGRMTFGSVLFDGRLRVADVDRFRRALRTGIGSGKAFGFGLLSIAPVSVRQAPDE